MIPGGLGRPELFVLKLPPERLGDPRSWDSLSRLGPASAPTPSNSARGDVWVGDSAVPEGRLCGLYAVV